jgi:hypothetical protein
VSSPRERQDEDEVLAAVLRRFLTSGEGYVVAWEDDLDEGGSVSIGRLTIDSTATLSSLELEVVSRVLS